MFYIRIINILFIRFFRLIYKKSFKNFGCKSAILFPLNIEGIHNISIGKNVYVAYKSWLAAVPHTGAEKCELIIDDGTSIGNFNHIYATKSIIIGKNVLTADKVYISDNLHGYEDVVLPIIKQSIKQINTVVIGEGTWLGENVCVIGAQIGRNCVIGANSVVTKYIPDYCVAVGSPAKVIKRYSFDRKQWERTDNDGNFIVLE